MKTKLLLFRTLALVACMACAISASAYEFEIDGIYYGRALPNTAWVTYKDANYNSYSGNVTIPSTVEYNGKTYTVKGIGAYAFMNSTGLTSVTIPSTVTWIGKQAFYNTGLSNVILPGAISTISDQAFDGIYYLQSVTCMATTPPTMGSNVFDLDVYSTVPLHVPSLFKWYYENADGWSNFQFINFNLETWTSDDPCFDTKINGVYYDITENFTVTVVNDCGGQSYSGNVGIPSTVTINNTTYTVTSIYFNAFSGCTGLTNVTMPNTITEIYDGAFTDCSALTTLTFPASLELLDSFVFYGCDALTGVTFLGTTPPIDNMDHAFDPYRTYEDVLAFVPREAMTTYENDETWGYWFPNKKNTLDYAANASGNNIQFNSTGTYPWTNVVEGSRTYVRSGNMAVHSSVSEMSANITVPSGYKSTRLYFDYKAWGEGTSPVYDKCIFYVDGVEQFCLGAEKNNWVRHNVELTPGTHTVVWSYQKDSSVNPTGDYFAVDNVNLYCENYENRLWTESINTPAGHTINIPVYLENSELVNRLQFDFKLPNYSNYLVDVIKGERLNEDAQVQFNANNGRVIIHDMMNTDVIINEPGQGVICYLKVKVPANMGGENPMDFTNMLLVEPSGNVYLDDWESWLCINGSIGDANNDGQVNIADVTTLIDYLLGVDVPQFDPINANVNQDDQINIADVTALIDQLLGL